MKFLPSVAIAFVLFMGLVFFGCASQKALPSIPSVPQTTANNSVNAPHPPSQAAGSCGDGICQQIEQSRVGLCPQDCGQDTAPKKPENTPTSGKVNKTGVLYLGYMVHLEGWNDTVNRKIMEAHDGDVRKLADLFEKYGAKLTLESNGEFNEGALKWNDSTLLEMEKRGHGIGLHADEGGSLSEGLTYQQFVQNLKNKKTALDAQNVSVRHVSGICSHLDWVNAAADAGFKFTTGQVAYCLMSMPSASRPIAYRDCKTPAACHDTYPEDLAERLTPYRMEGGANWLDDSPNGHLVLIPSSGVLICAYEEKNIPNYKKCEFEENDINASVAEIAKAATLSEPGRVNTYYAAYSLGAAPDLALMEKWLQAIKPLVDEGKVKWKTMPEMYDEYAG